MRSQASNSISRAGKQIDFNGSQRESEISEQDIRDRVKEKIPRLAKRVDDALLVEEMEICRGRARVDIALISDLLIGFEIKGPKDDVSRLPRQVEAYSECFDRVVLVVHENLAKKALPLIPDWWGIVIGYVRDGRLTYQLHRRGDRNPALNLDSLLALLWRDEMSSLFFSCVGETVSLKASKKEIRSKLLSSVDPSVLHCAGLKKLRERANWRSTRIAECHRAACV